MTFPFPFNARMRSWLTLLNPTLNNNDSGWSGFCNVSSLPTISATGSPYRLTLSPPSSGASLVLASCWVGMANTAPNFDGNQVQVKFAGLNGVTLTAGGADVVSDPFAASLNTSGSVLVALGITSGDLQRNIAATGYTLYYKAADAANAGSTSKAGYTSVASRVDVVVKLETFF